MRFFPKLIQGIDIDIRMIKNANKNIISLVNKNKKYDEAVNGSRMMNS
jgi:hypothetical protein